MFRFNGCIIKNIVLIKNVYEIMLGQNHYSDLFSLVRNTNFHLKLWTEECHVVSNWSKSLWFLAVNCFFIWLNFSFPLQSKKKKNVFLLDNKQIDLVPLPYWLGWHVVQHEILIPQKFLQTLEIPRLLGERKKMWLTISL